MSGKKIGTHSGTFHCDEVTGCMLLKNYTSEFKNCEIVRSRDKTVLDTLDIVIDVGGEYDHARHRYDHHQHGFNEFYNDKLGIKLSAAGLVYKHFGPEIIKNSLNDLFDSKMISDESLKSMITPEAIEKLTLSLYESFFITIDAIDNGIDRYPTDVKPRYKFYHTHLAARISRLNPNFWEDQKISYDDRFVTAMAVSKEEFLNELLISFMSKFASGPIVKESFDQRKQHDESGRILVLTKSCFWKEALFGLEKEENCQGSLIYVMYPDTSTGEWRVQAVPQDLGTFNNRGPLKEIWRGKTQEEIKTLSGLDDAVFCHHAGFIGGCKSFENTLKMAKISLEDLDQKAIQKSKETMKTE